MLKTVRMLAQQFLTLFFGVCFLLPQLVLADGMVVPPVDYWVQETDQEAVILYDQGIETLIISITFEGNAKDFGWVVPAPAQPTVEKGSDELFTNLEELTRQRYSYEENVFGLGTADSVKQPGVTIIETKKIDYYDVTVLSSTDEGSLTAWLNDNGYSFPESASYILDSYIENGWYFVAMKINPESLEWADVSQQLKTGHATPVSISFETKNIVYPLKISSVVSRNKDGAATGQTPDYTSGKIGMSVPVTDREITSIDADSAFNPTEGTIEMWFRPNYTWNGTATGYWEFLNVVDSDTDASGRQVLEVRRGKDSINDTLQFVAYGPTGTTQVWSANINSAVTWESGTWYSMAVTWSADQAPKFYLNGTEYQTEPSYSASKWEMRDHTGTTLYLGQRGDMLGSYSLRAAFDEVRISSSIKGADDILAAYNQVNGGKQLAVADDTLLLAHVDSSLKDEKSGEFLSYEDRETTAVTYDSYYEQPVTILLHVISDHRKTLPGFSTNYANWIQKESIERLALDDQGDPLLQPSEKKYYLTSLTRSMDYEEMTEDLFLRDADTNETIGDRIDADGPSSATPFYIAIGVGVALSIGIAITILVFSRKAPPAHGTKE
ncbi:MAG: DUF2330 domain-containing protein [Patescibacteria group bacterium]